MIGLTANDDTMVVINAYLDSLYGEISGDDALSHMVLEKYGDMERFCSMSVFFTSHSMDA